MVLPAVARSVDVLAAVAGVFLLRWEQKPKPEDRWERELEEQQVFLLVEKW